MSKEDKKILITDTSVLINFLNIERFDLLISFPGKFLITKHVIDEITSDFSEQQNQLNSALTRGELEIITVDSHQELQLFNELMKEKRLGSGECSAIACAIYRGFSLAMEDNRAGKQARKLKPSIEILKTQDLIARLIVEGAITVGDADAIKLAWQKKLSFFFKI